MDRHILLGVSLAFLLFASGSLAQYNNETSLAKTPFKSDIAFEFYKIGSHIPGLSPQCQIHMQEIFMGMANFHQWALEFPDSWGRMPFGLLWGHTISMGAYEQCIAASHKFANEELLRGKYCLTRVPIEKLMNKIQNDPQEKARISYKFKKATYFELGICVPNSCSAGDAQLILEDVIAEMYYPNIKDGSTWVTEKFCDVDKPIELRGIDIFAIVFICVVVFFMLAASVYDYNMTKKKQPKKPLFVAFSVLTNAPKIFTVKPTNNPNVINCLAGLRTFSMMWVVFGHGYMTFYELPHINKNKFYNWIETPYSMLVQNATLCVDTFFFMSGLLMLWGAFREMEKTNNVDNRQRLTYYPTHTRIPTWLCGVIFGYFFFTKNRGKQIALAKHWVLLGWTLAFGIMLTCLWGPYWRIRPENPDAPIIEGAFYEPLSRFSWSCSIAWIVWACYNGHGGLINDFLSWSFFIAMSRLSYCMYVIHRIVQLVNGGRLQHDTHFSDYDMVLRWWHDFGITLIASCFATLAFESPILGIEKAIFGHGDAPKPAPKKIEPTTTVTEVPVVATETPAAEDPSKA